MLDIYPRPLSASALPEPNHNSVLILNTPSSSLSSLTCSRLGPQRRSRVTTTNSLSPESRYGNDVVVAAELIGPFGSQTTGLTFPGWVWRFADWQLDLAYMQVLVCGYPEPQSSSNRSASEVTTLWRYIL